MQSLQDRYIPGTTCFGCGPANPKGLRLRSYLGDGDQTVAEFTPWSEHDNGLGYLNGGIICTVLDCHSATPMMVRAEELGLFEAGLLPYVTAGLDVRYLRPTPLGGPLHLWARVLDVADSAITVEALLMADGKDRAHAVSVWKPWRPR